MLYLFSLVSFWGIEGQLVSPTNWHLLFTTAMIKLWDTATADLQNLLKGVRVGDEEWGILCSEKTGRTGLQIVRHFLEKILWAQFLHLLISRKALKSFTMTFHDQQEPSAKNACLIAHTPPSPKSHIYWPFSYLFGVVSQSYLRYWFPGCSPYIAPDKKNLTCNSHIFLFFFFFKLTLP